MAEEILSELEDLDSTEFKEFSLYLQEYSARFINSDPESAEETRENVRELSEAGGNAVALSKLYGILTESDGPDEYVEEINSYRSESDFQDEIDGTIEEVFSGFFEEDEEYDF
jgi:hypothetical protein